MVQGHVKQGSFSRHNRYYRVIAMPSVGELQNGTPSMSMKFGCLSSEDSVQKRPNQNHIL